MMEKWVRLRQVAIATDDIAGVGDRIRAEYRLGPGFADPELDRWGILDDTIPIADAFLELVAPSRPDHPMSSFLASRSGGGGYCLSVQHPESRAAAARAAELGVRLAVEVEDFQGAYIVQLNPADVGVLLEFDGVTDRDRWFWDDRPDNVPTPADARIIDIVSVTIAVDAPDEMADRWRYIIGVDGSGTVIDLGEERTAEFVEVGDRGRGMIGMTVRSDGTTGAVGMDIGQFRIDVVS